MEKYEYGVNGLLSEEDKILIEWDNEEIKKYGHRLHRNFEIGDKVTLRDSRLYGYNEELIRLADTKEEVFINDIDFNDDGSIWSYDIVTKNKRYFYRFFPSEFNYKINISKEEKYSVYKKKDGYPAISKKEKDLPLIVETANLKEAEMELKRYLSKKTFDYNTNVLNKISDTLKKNEQNTYIKQDIEKMKKQIKYMLGLTFSDRMNDGRDISFDILLPIQFNTEKEAVDNQGLFFARMEYLDENVVISIYEKDEILEKNHKIINTIQWKDFYYYKCSITRKESIGKLCIDPMIDEEPCAERFDKILKKLTTRETFSLQCLAYWVEPAFQSIKIRQW